MDDGNLKAEWHLADLTNSNGNDPFGAVCFTTGVKVDLTATEEELGQICIDLLYKEGRLAKRGITCHWKDGGQDCLTCPHATLEPQERRSLLCRLGKDQCALEGRYREMNHARLAVDELATEVDAATELGHLPDDLVELLAQVGL